MEEEEEEEEEEEGGVEDEGLLKLKEEEKGWERKVQTKAAAAGENVECLSRTQNTEHIWTKASTQKEK